MPTSRSTNSGGTPPGAHVSDELISKVGAAVAKVAKIQQAYAARAETEATEEDKQELATEAQYAAVQAIGEEGISVDDYNSVVSAAGEDSSLEERLLNAARRVL